MDEALKQQLTLGRGFFQKRQYAQAERHLSAVAEAQPTFADVFNMLGVIFHDQGQFARAQRAFETALSINPGYTEAALNLAVIYNDLGRYEEARRVYQSALERQRPEPGELDPFVRGKIANLYADIGDVYASAGLFHRAREEYARALEHGPTFVDIRLKLANACRDAGDHDAAQAEFERLVEQAPGFMEARVQQGVALLAGGKRDAALRVWEDVLTRSPGHRSAEMYLRLSRPSPAGPGESTSAAEPGGPK